MKKDYLLHHISEAHTHLYHLLTHTADLDSGPHSTYTLTLAVRDLALVADKANRALKEIRRHIENVTDSQHP